ncbi:MAG: LapA family protein [Leptospiraceae bacterium]|nr:LapA family protein [Leptospiraceae bacterium]MCB1316380.1 LapA family protein [Leptospiraceae bacterium]MCB1321177.1 LapA family protein [Leptospiraceae bacterium]
MIPIRLTLLLIGAFCLVLLIIGNPQPVTLQFLFWNQSVELYKVIVVAFLLGVVLTIIYTGQWRQLIRMKDERYYRRRRF